MIDAGNFAQWLTAMLASLRGEAGTQVPCGDCVGCCVSSYHIALRPQDEHVVARVPAEHLLSAPNAPLGYRYMAYRDDGTCPMLLERRCSVYEHRPQTCRDYDCRVFTAAGIDSAGTGKRMINERIAAWRFSYATEKDRETHAAVQSAARFIVTHAARLPSVQFPTAPTGIAVLALKSYTVFLDATTPADDPMQTAQAIIAASREFDATASRL
jgi:Fe-S-cluster containining protein